MQIYVVIHIHGGVINAVETFSTPEAAAQCEKQWCDNLGIPFEEKAREKYYEENEVDDDILSETATLEITAYTELITELSNVERQLSLVLQPGTTLPNIHRLVDDARNASRKVMRELGYSGQF